LNGDELTEIVPDVAAGLRLCVVHVAVVHAKAVPFFRSHAVYWWVSVAV